MNNDMPGKLKQTLAKPETKSKVLLGDLVRDWLVSPRYAQLVKIGWEHDRDQLMAAFETHRALTHRATTLDSFLFITNHAVLAEFGTGASLYSVVAAALGLGAGPSSQEIFKDLGCSVMQMGENEEIDIYFKQAWDPRFDLYFYNPRVVRWLVRMARGEEPNQNRKKQNGSKEMEIIYNYSCSLEQALADATARDLENIKWGEEIYMRDDIGDGWRKTADIVDAPAFLVQVVGLSPGSKK